MPIRKPKLDKEEQRKFRALLLRLQTAGVITGTSGGIPPEPRRLHLRQLDDSCSRVHDLPGGQIVVVLLCDLMAFRAGCTLRDCAISLPWADLDLCDPGDIPYYENLIRRLA